MNSSLFILACVWYNFRPSSLKMTVTLNRAGCLTFGHSTYKDTHIDGGIAINWHDGCFQRKPIGYCRTPDFWCMKWPQTTAILPYCQTQTYYCLQMDCWLGIVHVVHPSGRPKNATFDWTRSPHGWCICGLKQQSTNIDQIHNMSMKSSPSIVARFANSAEFGVT